MNFALLSDTAEAAFFERAVIFVLSHIVAFVVVGVGHRYLVAKNETPATPDMQSRAFPSRLYWLRYLWSPTLRGRLWDPCYADLSAAYFESSQKDGSARLNYSFAVQTLMLIPWMVWFSVMHGQFDDTYGAGR